MPKKSGNKSKSSKSKKTSKKSDIELVSNTLAPVKYHGKMMRSLVFESQTGRTTEDIVKYLQSKKSRTYDYVN